MGKGAMRVGRRGWGHHRHTDRQRSSGSPDLKVSHCNGGQGGRWRSSTAFYSLGQDSTGCTTERLLK